MIKAVALDVDGTITDKRRRGCISAIETIYKVENLGIPVIINNWKYFMFHKGVINIFSYIRRYSC